MPEGLNHRPAPDVPWGMPRSGLRPAWQRWAVVLLGVAVLASLPTALALWPARAENVTAADLLAAVQGSGDAHYSGYAEARGGLVLPVTEEFTDVVNLFGSTSRMRVWWRTAQDWRVDTVTASGETDLFHRSDATVLWDYESNTARVSRDPEVRLPRTADLLPSALGQRLLSEATAEEVARLPERRIAGRTALGLRLTPTDERTTIANVDVWVDPGTGVPLRVEVLGADGVDAVTATFLDFTAELPDGEVTGFVAPPGADFGFTDVVDVAAAVNQFGPVAAPDTLAGLPGRDDATAAGAVGEYGRGVTLLTASPVWDRFTRPLRDQLESTPGAVVDEYGVTVSAGPLTLLLTPGSRERISWVLAGTVDRDTLVAAAQELEGIRVADG